MILNKFKYGLMAAASAATLAAFSAPAMAQDDQSVEQLQILGSRSTKPRVAVDSPVPVDVINAVSRVSAISTAWAIALA